MAVYGVFNAVNSTIQAALQVITCQMVEAVNSGGRRR
jgi:hypothetical protein